MSRLTTGKGNMAHSNIRCECPHVKDGRLWLCVDCNSNNYRKIVIKLADLEDKLADGRLVEVKMIWKCSGCDYLKPHKQGGFWCFNLSIFITEIVFLLNLQSKISNSRLTQVSFEEGNSVGKKCIMKQEATKKLVPNVTIKYMLVKTNLFLQCLENLKKGNLLSFIQFFYLIY